MPQIHGWESRFEANIEDRGCLHIPVVLRHLPPDAQTLQVLIGAWYDNAPISPNVYLQFERYPALEYKNTHAISWTHTEVALPRFLDAAATTLLWEPQCRERSVA